jgi:putative phage-type endonuclease
MSERWFSDVAEEVLCATGEIEADEERVCEYISLVEDLFGMFIEASSSRIWDMNAAPMDAGPQARLEYVDALLKRPQIPQRTADWYKQSRNVLTASEFSEILGTDRAVNAIVLKKLESQPQRQNSRLACSTCEMSAMDWGVRFEPVVKQIMKSWGSDVLDVGRIIHETDPSLAASPDGIIMASAKPEEIGCLIEIKCPVRREIGGKIPFEYWCQMQVQMEVTGISKCEYMEMKFVSPYRGDTEPYKAPAADVTPKAAGTLWLLQHVDSLDMCYAYTEEERDALLATEWHLTETIPWHLDSFFQASVTRDTNWFHSTLGKRADFWKRVEDARSGAYVIPQKVPKSPKTPIVNVCKIMDD